MDDKYSLDVLIHAQTQGLPKGIPSICSAHPIVLQAAMRRAKHTGNPLLIEATCNQVNQFGGYTGMTPQDFIHFVHGLARENGLPEAQILLGGDHLGPFVWQNEPADTAMAKACELVRAYVQAGFTKIHLDASMPLGGDPLHVQPDIELFANRAIQMAQAAEQTSASIAVEPSIRYVIGTEVPLPGGAQSFEEGVQVTCVEDAQQTLTCTKQAFLSSGLEHAWERVIALVVQPGVEYGDDFILDYNPAAASSLSRMIESYPDMVYEAHSTDYQARQALSNLVLDHFAILKVGPALTFAYREAAFALAAIENEIFSGNRAIKRSALLDALEQTMLQNPAYWQKYYRGSEQEQHFARKYSFSDRIRYYWPAKPVQQAMGILIQNLSKEPIPLSLLSQYLPHQYEAIRGGRLSNDPREILLYSIDRILEDYEYAAGV